MSWPWADPLDNEVLPGIHALGLEIRDHTEDMRSKSSLVKRMTRCSVLHARTPCAARAMLRHTL